MRANWRYLTYAVRHKWFVLLEGWGRVGLWRLLIHDWSKFTPSEWAGYRDFFYGPWQDAVVLSPSGGRAKAPAKVAYAFDRAWLHHQRENDHHWQHWLATEWARTRAFTYDVLFKDDGTKVCLGNNAWGDLPMPNFVPLPMPDACREEMLADWRGAGRAVGRPDTAAWYRKNRDNINLHPETRAWVEDRLGVAG